MRCMVEKQNHTPLFIHDNRMLAERALENVHKTRITKLYNVYNANAVCAEKVQIMRNKILDFLLC